MSRPFRLSCQVIKCAPSVVLLLRYKNDAVNSSSLTHCHRVCHSRHQLSMISVDDQDLPPSSLPLNQTTCSGHSFVKRCSSGRATLSILFGTSETRQCNQKHHDVASTNIVCIESAPYTHNFTSPSRSSNMFLATSTLASSMPLILSLFAVQRWRKNSSRTKSDDVFLRIV